MIDSVLELLVIFRTQNAFTKSVFIYIEDHNIY